ncbi:unnamed protein product [Vitrella brassicaformis CCMP3155]|uniref:C3H1-type domain-containing protein n=5 Tax=Vitrella brassicaformis TaxID=1169539 RepID=A0A0G4EKQ5_VITBC|nr:unnamed protein product [Vitrella brassicaformis CCMP3155]|eukprot:CEL97731.1 unnamed protein product [Vitrella brassicaformis CCMP3155]
MRADQHLGGLSEAATARHPHADARQNGGEVRLSDSLKLNRLRETSSRTGLMTPHASAAAHQQSLVGGTSTSPASLMNHTSISPHEPSRPIGTLPNGHSSLAPGQASTVLSSGGAAADGASLVGPIPPPSAAVLSQLPTHVAAALVQLTQQQQQVPATSRESVTPSATPLHQAAFRPQPHGPQTTPRAPSIEAESSPKDIIGERFTDISPQSTEAIGTPHRSANDLTRPQSYGDVLFANHRGATVQRLHDHKTDITPQQRQQRPVSKTPTAAASDAALSSSDDTTADLVNLAGALRRMQQQQQQQQHPKQPQPATPNALSLLQNQAASLGLLNRLSPSPSPSPSVQQVSNGGVGNASLQQYQLLQLQQAINTIMQQQQQQPGSHQQQQQQQQAATTVTQTTGGSSNPSPMVRQGEGQRAASDDGSPRGSRRGGEGAGRSGVVVGIGIGGRVEMPEGQGPELPMFRELGENEEHMHFMFNCHTRKCPRFGQGHCPAHKPMVCFDFHFDSQKRRRPITESKRLAYWDIQCEFINHPNNCPRGLSCPFAHSKDEISYHPAKYKTRLCNSKDCRKQICCFAHEEHELRRFAQSRYSHLILSGAANRANARSDRSPPPSTRTQGTTQDALAVKGASAAADFSFAHFKTQPCRNKAHAHDRKICPFYHNLRDRRRPPFGQYKAEPCEDHFDLELQSLACKKGDACDKCHNRLELLYHPEVYKQRFCATYPDVSRCQRGKFCAFAHSREEIRCPIFSPEEESERTADFFMSKFKTKWCPYGIQHDWHSCVYAHTYQDFRRTPELGYGSEPCPYWEKDKDKHAHALDYEQRCPNKGFYCQYAHGSKEQLYHPSYYKVMPCADWKANGWCPRGDLCAFYHDASQKRYPPATNFDYTKPLASIDKLQTHVTKPILFNLEDPENITQPSPSIRGETGSPILMPFESVTGSGRPPPPPGPPPPSAWRPTPLTPRDSPSHTFARSHTDTDAFSPMRAPHSSLTIADVRPRQTQQHFIAPPHDTSHVGRGPHIHMQDDTPLRDTSDAAPRLYHLTERPSVGTPSSSPAPPVPGDATRLGAVSPKTASSGRHGTPMGITRAAVPQDLLNIWGKSEKQLWAPPSRLKIAEMEPVSLVESPMANGNREGGGGGSSTKSTLSTWAPIPSTSPSAPKRQGSSHSAVLSAQPTPADVPGDGADLAALPAPAIHPSHSFPQRPATEEAKGDDTASHNNMAEEASSSLFSLTPMQHLHAGQGDHTSAGLLRSLATAAADGASSVSPMGSHQHDHHGIASGRATRSAASADGGEDSSRKQSTGQLFGPSGGFGMFSLAQSPQAEVTDASAETQQRRVFGEVEGMVDQSPSLAAAPAVFVQAHSLSHAFATVASLCQAIDMPKAVLLLDNSLVPVRLSLAPSSCLPAELSFMADRFDLFLACGHGSWERFVEAERGMWIGTPQRLKGQPTKQNHDKRRGDQVVLVHLHTSGGHLAESLQEYQTIHLDGLDDRSLFIIHVCVSESLSNLSAALPPSVPKAMASFLPSWQAATNLPGKSVLDTWKTAILRVDAGSSSASQKGGVDMTWEPTEDEGFIGSCADKTRRVRARLRPADLCEEAAAFLSHHVHPTRRPQPLRLVIASPAISPAADSDRAEDSSPSLFPRSSSVGTVEGFDSAQTVQWMGPASGSMGMRLGTSTSSFSTPSSARGYAAREETEATPPRPPLMGAVEGASGSWAEERYTVSPGQQDSSSTSCVQVSRVRYLKDGFHLGQVELPCGIGRATVGVPCAVRVGALADYQLGEDLLKLYSLHCQQQVLDGRHTLRCVSLSFHPSIAPRVASSSVLPQGRATDLASCPTPDSSLMLCLTPPPRASLQTLIEGCRGPPEGSKLTCFCDALWEWHIDRDGLPCPESASHDNHFQQHPADELHSSAPATSTGAWAESPTLGRQRTAAALPPSLRRACAEAGVRGLMKLTPHTRSLLADLMDMACEVECLRREATREAFRNEEWEGVVKRLQRSMTIDNVLMAAATVDGNGDAALSPRLDIFSLDEAKDEWPSSTAEQLGCLLVYCLTGGGRITVDALARTAEDGGPSWLVLRCIGEYSPLAYQLIAVLLGLPPFTHLSDMAGPMDMQSGTGATTPLGTGLFLHHSTASPVSAGGFTMSRSPTDIMVAPDAVYHSTVASPKLDTQKRRRSGAVPPVELCRHHPLFWPCVTRLDCLEYVYTVLYKDMAATSATASSASSAGRAARPQSDVLRQVRERVDDSCDGGGGVMPLDWRQVVSQHLYRTVLFIQSQKTAKKASTTTTFGPHLRDFLRFVRKLRSRWWEICMSSAQADLQAVLADLGRSPRAMGDGDSDSGLTMEVLSMKEELLCRQVEVVSKGLLPLLFDVVNSNTQLAEIFYAASAFSKVRRAFEGPYLVP